MHQTLVQKLTHIIDQIIYMLSLCHMINLSVFLHVVVVADTPDQTTEVKTHGIHGSTPVFGSQRDYIIAVVILEAAFFDLHQQIIEIFRGTNGGRINIQRIYDRLLNIRSAYVSFRRIIDHGSVYFINPQMQQIYLTAKIFAEHDILVSIIGQIALFHVLGIHL